MAFIVDFSKLRDAADIARALSCSVDLITTIVGGDKSPFEHHLIPKRNPARGKREVWEIIDTKTLEAYRAFHDRFSDYASERLLDFPHPCVHGYVSKRSIVSNAREHIGSIILLRADIRDYFQTIKTPRIKAHLLDLGILPDAAEILSQFLTLDGSLPLGFPSSPLLANIVSLELDRDFTTLAAQFECKYTRYADDLTFSSTANLPARIDIESTLRKHGFTLAIEKLRIKKRGQAFYVTGLSISGTRPRAARPFKRQLEQELYYAETYGLYQHIGRAGYSSYQAGINKIDGRIRFLYSVEPDLARKYYTRWSAVLNAANATVAYEPRMAIPPREVSIFVDESEAKTTAGNILMLGAILTEDTDAIRTQLNALLDDKIADPFIAGRKTELVEKGLHWVDMAEDVRTDIVELLGQLPFRAYIAYAPLTTNSDYEATYLRLFRALIERRLIALDRSTTTIYCETNDRINRRSLESAVADIYSVLHATNNRRPRIEPSLVIATKREQCLALADTALAVFREYALCEKKHSELAVRRFERLRTKFRLIASEQTREVFTRRKAFNPWKNGDPTIPVPRP